MPDIFTPNLNLTKPEVGSSRDAWGGKWNGNADTLDAVIKALQDKVTALDGRPGVPSGIIADFGSAVVPSGWLRCNGAVLSQAAYQNLYAAIGPTWNVGGEQSGTFRLPDIRGIFRRGLDEGRGVDAGRGLSPAVQGSQNLSHIHSLTGGGYVMQLYGSGPQITLATGNEMLQPGVHAVDIAASGGSESRPVNLAFPACIKI